MRHAWKWVGRLAVVTAAGLAPAACSDDPGPPKEDAPVSPSPFREYAIHVFANTKEGPKQIDFPPVHAVSAPGRSGTVAGGLASTQQVGPGAKPLTQAEVDGGTVDLEQAIQGLTEPGWALLLRAVAQCHKDLGGESVGDPLVLDQPWWNRTSPSWLGNWYVFADKLASNGTNTFLTCEEILKKSESLACAAGKLKEAADTLSPIVWEAVPDVSFRANGSVTYPAWMKDEWVLVPQSQKDKFILRDLAINALAHVARLQLEVPVSAIPTATCMEAYVEAAKDVDNVHNPYHDVLYGFSTTEPYSYFTPTWPNDTAQGADPQSLAEARLRFNAHILRASGRLLRDLIDESVMADLAGAEKQRALAGDARRGPEYLWGARTESDAPYNSLAHAFRVVFGRWESARSDGWDAPPIPNGDAPLPTPVSTCGGLLPMELLIKADGTSPLGAGQSARWRDKRVMSTGQQFAVGLIDRAGLVIPKHKLDESQSTFGEVKNIVKQQLLLTAAYTDDQTPNLSDPITVTRGEVIGKLVDDIPDTDLRFALDRGWSAYRLVAGASEEQPTLAAPPGIKLAAAAAVTSELTGVNGNVLAGGVPRQDAAVDIMARVGPGQAASMCPEFDPGTVPAANMGKVSAFQDAFLIGDLFRRRLSALRQAVEDPNPSSYPTTLPNPPCVDCDALGASSFPDLAETASAELRAWTGPAHLAFKHEADPEGGAFYLVVQGLAPEDLGVKTRADMKNNLVLVWGKPWVADCAARTRQSCPEDFVADYVKFADGELTEDAEFAADPEIPNIEEWKGSDGRLMVLAFADSGPPEFQPSAGAIGSESENFVYLVALSHPENPGKGRVLATFPFYQEANAQWLYSLVSSHQRKLANDLFGVANGFGQGSRGVGKSSATDPPGYCIDGVPRDFFVPLENELTSDNDGFEDSWKHYLEAAKQAATRADELGNKLIDLGLQQDYRREAANEEVAKICGEYGAVDESNVHEGQVEAPADDTNLAYCLNEPSYDIVFLSAPPPEKNDNGQDIDIRTDIVGCDQNPPIPGADTSPLCKNFADDDALRKGMGALNLAPYYDPDQLVEPAGKGASCDSAIGIVTSLSSAFAGDQLQGLASEDDMSSDSMASVVHGTRVFVADDGNWEVFLEGAKIMSTSDVSYWPACGGACTGLAAQLGEIFWYTGSPSAEDRDALLQNVTGTIWLMAAMAGQLPEGVFNLPIPARQGFTSGEDVAPVLFGHGTFISSGGDLVLDVSDVGDSKIPDDNKSILGPGTTIDGNFAQGASSSSTARPQWVKNIYSSPGSYLHVRTKNAARAFKKMESLVGFFSARGKELNGLSTSTCSSAGNAQWNAASEILKIKEPDGYLCPAPDGKGPLLQFSYAGSGIADIFEHQGDVPASDKIPNASSGWDGHHEWNHVFGYDLGDGCLHSINPIGTEQYPTVSIKQSCLNYASNKNIFPIPDHSRFTINALLPQACPPDRRAQLYINSIWKHKTPCEAALELSRTLALTCVLNRTYRPLGPGESLPPLVQPGDIIKLENWIGDQSRAARIALSRLYLTDVPKRVVDDFESGKVGTGALKGEHGQLVLQYRQHLSTLASGWIGLEKDLDAIKLAITNARLGLVAVDLAKQKELRQIAMTELQIEAQMLKSVVHAAGSIAGAFGNPANTNPFGAASDGAQAAIDVTYGLKQKAILSEIKQIADKQAANQVLQILNTLQGEVNERYTTIQQTLQSMQAGVAGALQTASALKQKQNDAKYQVAKGAGEPYAVLEDGKVVSFPVNAVLRNQYDITKRRYDAALKEAKYMAYMARLAIEQRIGLRLVDLHDPVGALAAPSEWADDVCSFQGVNYELLRASSKPPDEDASPMTKLIWKFLAGDYAKWADPYIGDYVDRLEKFVEFYNIAYPSHEGDDVAVLSIRDDLLGPQGRCYREANNLLFHSHSLDRRDALQQGGVEQVRGWTQSRCEDSDAKCLRVVPGDVLRELDPNTQEYTQIVPPPGVATIEGYTWLHDDDGANFVKADPAAPLPPTYQAPRASVYQAVDLEAGSYVLSWFDRSWSDQPDLPPSVASPDYRAMVYGPSWEVIEAYIEPPHLSSLGADAGASTDAWSPRRLVPFEVSQPGTHYILFGASVAGPSHGSVVIADVQLERAASASAATGYEATDASRLVLSGDCVSGSAQGFQAAFDYVCDKEACFHELRQPFIIDTRTIDSAESKLIGKIAEGNFNFRHISVALNVVGTGVTDCSKTPTPSCYGTGYLEYSLVHDAFATPVISHLSKYQAEFNFGAASINRGKALAAERFITLPVGSADQSLISQPEIQKQEYRGRPLSGSYRLRIYDAPNLVWSQVEDIQIVLNYRYWSRVDRESQQK